LAAIRNLAKGGNLPHPDDSEWLIGYSTTGTDFPPELVLRQFSQNRQPTDLQIVWLGLLIRSLHRANVLTPGATPGPLTTADLPIEALFTATQGSLDACFSALDRLDLRLAQTSRWVFVSYDDLDRVSAGDWDALRTLLRGLIQFWSSYVRRWKHLRPKIFLRRDLFNRVALLGPDVSKISPQRVELLWSTRNMYALLVKRLANHSPLLAEYVDPATWEGEDQGELGWCPLAMSDDPYRKFVERMCGQYMGAHPSRGRSFTWIPNHLQDSNGQVLPRSMVRFFESAADLEQRTPPKARWPQLFHHTSMRAAVDEVSQSRVQEMEDEEFPWMRAVREKLASLHPQVPIERRELERLLIIDWEGSADRPPETSGYGLLQLLMDLGIFYLRGDGRVDARDLYLKGFGLKRKGGVARPH
jgi:hypothetical protein